MKLINKLMGRFHHARLNRLLKKRRKRMFKKALEFNKKHAFTNSMRWEEGRWMDPDTGEIWKATGRNLFTGTEYARCSRFHVKHRCFKEHATND